MPETFLILLCGGVMFAAFVPKSTDVTRHWLRLCGVIAMTTFGLSALFWSRRSGLDRETLAGYLSALVMIAIHLALVQMGQTAAARLAAIVAAMVTLPLGLELLGRPEIVPVAAAFVGCAGAAAMCGLVSMEMLLGRAYLGTDKMSTAPFRRMNFVFAAVLLLRIFFGVCAMLMEQTWPVEWFWTRQGLLIATRWLVGLLAPSVLIYMIHDRIKRGSTRSATGMLYVMGVLVFAGEIIALWLTRETGLPF